MRLDGKQASFLKNVWLGSQMNKKDRRKCAILGKKKKTESPGTVLMLWGVRCQVPGVTDPILRPLHKTAKSADVRPHPY